MSEPDYLDPRVRPNKWLEVMLNRLLEAAVTEKDPLALGEAISELSFAHSRLAMWVEPGMIEDVFNGWIEPYVHELEKQKNSKADGSEEEE